MRCLHCGADDTFMYYCKKEHSVCQDCRLPVDTNVSMEQKKNYVCECLPEFQKNRGILTDDEWNNEYEGLLYDNSELLETECPYCQLVYIEDSVLVSILLKTLRQEREAVVKQLRSEFETLDNLKKAFEK
jgi:hypothetical protein